MAAVTLEFESAEVPEAGEKVSSFSVPPLSSIAVAAAVAVAAAAAWGADAADETAVGAAAVVAAAAVVVVAELLLLLEEAAAAAAAARDGGRSLSMSALPNSHPGGRVSSLQRASSTVLSQTRDV